MEVETHLKNPDFITVAKGYRISGRKIEKRAELNDAVSEMVAHDGPYLLEVAIEQENNVFPMVPAGSSVSDIMLEPNK